MPSFYNNRWPLLTECLLAKGWNKAEEGEFADLAYYDEGKWQNEGNSMRPARIKFFSRCFTDIPANKRSCAFAMLAHGLSPDIYPRTFVDFAEWEAALKEQSQGDESLWFFKKKNSTNSRGISVTSSVEGGRQILALHAFSQSKGEPPVSSSLLDDEFAERMRGLLLAAKERDAVETSSAKDLEASVPSVAHLREALGLALCSSSAKLEDAMRQYIIQESVKRPLLIQGGRKFCLRAFVLVLVRPLPLLGDVGSSDVAASNSRELEVYLSSLHHTRPMKAPFDPLSRDGRVLWEDTTTLFCSAADGSQYPAERWHERQFPRLKEAVRRIMGAFPMIDPQELVDSPGFKGFHGKSPKPTPQPIPHDEGRIAIMGFDFMIDEDDKPWLLEINSICNMQNTKTSEVDTRNKTLMAEALYDMVLAPLVDVSVEPKASEHFHRVI